jgi:hypothetical protein
MLASVLGAGCAWFEKKADTPCPDPNSCECPTNQNPGCAPWPDDNGDNPSQMTKRPDGGVSK